MEGLEVLEGDIIQCRLYPVEMHFSWGAKLVGAWPHSAHTPHLRLNLDRGAPGNLEATKPGSPRYWAMVQ